MLSLVVKKGTKELFLALGLILVATLVSCGGSQSENVTLKYSPTPKGEENKELVLSAENGYISIFNGKDLTGWRGYGKDKVPGKWTVEDGCLKFNGAGGGEAQDGDGGDIIFAHKFSNFELEFEWKISKGGNSGLLYLAQEITSTDENGNERFEPIYISAPEYQLLDNDNHPDAKLGAVEGIRKSASLYDMIPAQPQNSKPHGEWNKAKLIINKGVVSHIQNDKKVLEYKLWTPEWTELLQKSKFSEQNWPLAFELLNNCGGANREGFIGFQDHGDDVWLRNIRVKELN